MPQGGAKSISRGALRCGMIWENYASGYLNLYCAAPTEPLGTSVVRKPVGHRPAEVARCPQWEILVARGSETRGAGAP